MTKTEQAMIDLLVRRHEAMQSKHKLRKEIAVIKRRIKVKVASGDLEGVDDNWYSEASYMDGGDPDKITHVYTTDELEDLYRDYHGCRDEIACILAAIRYQCGKHIEQKKMRLTNETSRLEKEPAQ